MANLTSLLVCFTCPLELTPHQVLTETVILPGWRPKVADVDVNNDPVPGSLITFNDLTQHGEM